MRNKAISVASRLLEDEEDDPKDYIMGLNLVYGYESIWLEEGDEAQEILDIIRERGPKAALNKLKRYYAGHGEHETYCIGDEEGDPAAVDPKLQHFTDKNGFVLSWRENPPVVHLERAVMRNSRHGRELLRNDQIFARDRAYADLRFDYPALWRRIAEPYIKRCAANPKYRAYRPAQGELPEDMEDAIYRLMTQALNQGIKE